MENKQNFYPVMIDLSRFKILIAGAGKIGLRKALQFSRMNKDVTVISERFEEGFSGLNNVHRIKKRITLEDIEGFNLVYVATDNSNLNSEISQYCLERNILVNSVDNHENSTFINVGFFNIDCEEDICFMVSTYGKNPKMTKKLIDEMKKNIETGVK